MCAVCVHVCVNVHVGARKRDERKEYLCECMQKKMGEREREMYDGYL